MGQPDIQQTVNSVSVEGFDQIYQPDPNEVQSAPELGPTIGSPWAQTSLDQQVQPDPSEGISLEDAAKVLGLHMDTVRKHLQKGKIKGFKVADKFGEKWLVHKDELTKARSIHPHPALPPQAEPELIQPHPIEQVRHDPGHAQDDPIVEIEIGPAQVRHDPAQLIQADLEYQRLMTIIESQAHQLKAAGDVIVYLRNEAEEAKQQVKLLTDSQHKRGWWVRFCSWLVGSRPPV